MVSNVTSLVLGLLVSMCLATAMLPNDDPRPSVQEQRHPGKLLPDMPRPTLAIWRNSDSHRETDQPAPLLRLAVWHDGQFIVANDPTVWKHEYRRGRISPQKVTQLKQALMLSNVVTLKQTCYLVPSAPVDCVMVDLGESNQQMLYWDEVESANYGININPKPHHLEFMRIWKLVNQIGLLAIPETSSRVDLSITIPDSWTIKREIQSE